MTKAIQYLRVHLAERFHLDDVAAEVGLSSFQICRLFKLHTGITMTEYAGRLRVESARRRLEDPTRQISSIAYEVGFSSLSQFNRNFLKYAGESPSQYRARLEQLEHCAFVAL
jgi:AraC-like DNA-binding protein